MEFFSVLALIVLFFLALEDHKTKSISNAFVVLLFVVGALNQVATGLQLGPLFLSVYFLYLASRSKDLGLDKAIGKGDLVVFSAMSLAFGNHTIPALVITLFFILLQEKDVFYKARNYPLLPLVWLATFIAVM